MRLGNSSSRGRGTSLIQRCPRYSSWLTSRRLAPSLRGSSHRRYSSVRRWTHCWRNVGRSRFFRHELTNDRGLTPNQQFISSTSWRPDPEWDNTAELTVGCSQVRRNSFLCSNSWLKWYLPSPSTTIFMASPLLDSTIVKEFSNLLLFLTKY